MLFDDHWLAALERLVAEKRLSDPAAMLARKEAWAEAYPTHTARQARRAGKRLQLAGMIGGLIYSRDRLHGSNRQPYDFARQLGCEPDQFQLKGQH